MAEIYQPFALERLRGSLCSCGAPTIAEHEFCFCSPRCAREDALRALGASESHYRNVFKRACVPPEPSLRRLASSGVLRPGPSIQPEWTTKSKTAKPELRTGNSQPYRNNVAHGTLPTLEQVTEAVLAKNARNGGHLGSDRDRARWGGPGSGQRGDVWQSTVHQEKPRGNVHAIPTQISLYPIPMPQDVQFRPVLREQPLTTGLRDATNKSAVQYSNKGKMKAQGNTAEFGSQKHSNASKGNQMFGHPVNPSYAPATYSKPPPRLLPQAPPVIRPLPPLPPPNPVILAPAEKRRSQTLRRSASFAGWDIPTGSPHIGGDEALMRAFAQVRAELRAVGDEEFDISDYFRDEEDDY
ncbi:hypothetical protein F5J12DRAFT_300861 [Pisolithus orientalis]|uniref:uncharacterized protein n=1 Tax=Pisolithus orientalis TaxID=936130 RepID=UPI0022247C1E|nr:uncharacterized protein F5J12DRAFT_300861 [Pisolithus orientalis]KAI6030620.1 hypothetical protein F5J12DRAFT_300861 [Pisolithus orientalis]